MVPLLCLTNIICKTSVPMRMRCVPGKAFSVKRPCPVYFCRRIFDLSEICQSQRVAKQNRIQSKPFLITPETGTKQTGRQRRSNFESRRDITAGGEATVEGKSKVSASPETATTTVEQAANSGTSPQDMSGLAMDSADRSGKAIEARIEGANRAPKERRKLRARHIQLWLVQRHENLLDTRRSKTQSTKYHLG